MKGEVKMPSRILLVSYPKIVFLYPTFVVSLAAAIYLSLVQPPLDTASTPTIVLSVVFLAVWATNLVVLAFNFPRTSSLALLFLFVAVAMGAVLLSVLKPAVLPYIAATLGRFHPLANASFYWVFSLSLGLATLGAIIVARFDYWEARPNELLHHQGLWGDMDRFPAPGVRIDKEISDVFEYLLLQSGRLILHTSGERRSIVLDNVPFITRKEKALTQLLGTLQVAVRPEGVGAPE
jgi:signal transduction histidine kinase